MSQKDVDMKDPEIGKVTIDQLPGEGTLGSVSSVEDLQTWKSQAASAGQVDPLSGKIQGTDVELEGVILRGRDSGVVTIDSGTQSFRVGEEVYSRKHKAEGVIRDVPGSSSAYPERYKVRFDSGNTIWVKPKYLVRL